MWRRRRREKRKQKGGRRTEEGEEGRDGGSTFGSDYILHICVPADPSGSVRMNRDRYSSAVSRPASGEPSEPSVQSERSETAFYSGYLMVFDFPSILAASQSLLLINTHKTRCCRHRWDDIAQMMSSAWFSLDMMLRTGRQNSILVLLDERSSQSDLCLWSVLSLSSAAAPLTSPLCFYVLSVRPFENGCVPF